MTATINHLKDPVGIAIDGNFARFVWGWHLLEPNQPENQHWTQR